MKNISKIIVILLIAIILMFFIVEAYMFISLSGIYFHAKEILQGEVYIPEELDSYSWYYGYDSYRADKVELDIRPVWAWHGIKKGSLWIRYSVKTYDKNGEEMTGCGYIGSEIEVEKIDGKWTAVAVHEDP